MSEEVKRLYRSRTDRMVSGVSAGLGEYFNIDPTLFRALFVILALFNGIGLFLYILLVIIIPNKPETGAMKSEKSNAVGSTGEAGASSGDLGQKDESGFGKRNLLGFFVVLLGLMLLVGQFFPRYLRWLTWETVGALAIIFVGIYLITKK